LIVDTSGAALKDAVDEGLFLIKPNLDELSNLYGKEKLWQTEILTAARSIIQNGGCEVMVVSMGKEGAMLITKTSSCR
jgi:6-phosphofructokinase 2